MTYLSSLSRLALLSTASLALASACGGSSFSNGNGGEGGDGGSNRGGSRNTAGTQSTAGKANGGSTGTGGSTSAGGSAPAAGTGNGGGSPGGEACNAPAQSGNCEAYFESWFHDVTTGLCRPFVYGGCGGNANRYGSFEECQEACPGGSPNYDTCQEPADCMVTTTGCCGICDGPNISARDLLAHNKAFAGKIGTCGAGDIACAPCPAPLPGQGSLKYFVPDCVQGQCAVLDLRTSDYTACETAQDCRLRNGTACCEGCGGGEPIAVRNDGSFEKLVCGSEPVACPACDPIAPPDAAAACIEGHCTAVYAVPVAE
jgi:hypothetical protein